MTASKQQQQQQQQQQQLTNLDELSLRIVLAFPNASNTGFA